jgi:hypothetical protein
MDQKYDPRNVLTAMHHKLTGELLHLMDGFYSNIEDGLFELAFRDTDDAKQRHCFDLMREMRYRRTNLIQTFARRMQQNLEGWFNEVPLPKDHSDEFAALARGMSEKCSAHFNVLLANITERTAYATERDPNLLELPISPFQIACCFVLSCRSLEFDKHSIEIVQELFGRFVLDRLGAVYGECNQRLEEMGFFTTDEIRELQLMSSA